MQRPVQAEQRSARWQNSAFGWCEREEQKRHDLVCPAARRIRKTISTQIMHRWLGLAEPAGWRAPCCDGGQCAHREVHGGGGSGVPRCKSGAAYLAGKGHVRVNGKDRRASRRLQVRPGGRTQCDVIWAAGSADSRTVENLYHAQQARSGRDSTCADDKGRATGRCIIRAILTAASIPSAGWISRPRGSCCSANDGELANKLTHPSHGVAKRYYCCRRTAMVSPEVRSRSSKRACFIEERQDGARPHQSHEGGAPEPDGAHHHGHPRGAQPAGAPHV